MALYYGRSRHLALLIGVIFCFIFASAASSVVVTISATVSGAPPEEPPTKVHFTGKAYPGSTVHFLKNGTSIATTQADPLAAFDVELTVDPGSFTFSIYATDVNDMDGKSFQISLTLSEGSTTTVSGIFLAPTLATDESQYMVGDTITLFGQTVPNSNVTVTVSSDPTVAHVTADSNGIYLSQFVAGDGNLVVGNHTGKAKATAPSTQVSETSNTVAFSIGMEHCGVGPGDLNCDGHVDLVDFSIMLFYWNQQHPELAAADINGDSVVNIVDFSILLYYWTG